MISKKIEKNRKNIIEKFNNSSDLELYEFEGGKKKKFFISYIDGLIDQDLLDRDVLGPIIDDFEDIKDLKKTIKVSSLKETNNIEEIIEEITYGSIGLFVDGTDLGYIIELRKWNKRSIEEPDAETVVRGPKEGFIEDLGSNRVLLRRKIRNENLVFEDYILGEQTNTKISLAYIVGIVNEDVLEELRRRINKINIDAILETGYIEQLIDDRPYSFLTTIGDTQKPDVVAGRILEGRIAIFCDGTPHVLTIPKLFIENIQTSEDYYTTSPYSTFLRIIRVFSLFISIVLPGFYVALQTFHQEMVPTVLLITMAGAREGVPFPAMVEALLMTIVLDVIKESGIRLPRSVGSAVSIVGALVLGEAAVEAGLISAPMVIIIATTAIAEFTVPTLVEGISIYRLIIIILGGVMGLYGITCGLVVIVVQIISLDSFGIPYTSPMAPVDKEGLKDTVVRFPLKRLIFRPRSIERRNITRQRDKGMK
ncbi:MAG TPA: spore germination protein [Tissierellales bacterium]|nr:spore germination protein [Tissierellales bacterium]